LRAYSPMMSIKQIAANHQNARYSTGPVTNEGKKRSRRSTIRHGAARFARAGRRFERIAF